MKVEGERKPPSEEQEDGGQEEEGPGSPMDQSCKTAYPSVSLKIQKIEKSENFLQMSTLKTNFCRFIKV